MSGSDLNPHPNSGTGSSNADHVVIDILPEGDLDYNRQFTRRILVDSTAMIVETNLGLAGQAIGAVMATSLSNGSSTCSWWLYLVELFIIIGLSFTYAAIALRPIKPYLSVVAAKIGAVAIAAAIIISASSHLPPIVAFAVSPFALLVILAALVFA